MTMPAPPPSTTEPSAYTVGAIKPADASSATIAPTHNTNAASRGTSSPVRQVRCQSQQKTYAPGEVTKGYLLAGKRKCRTRQPRDARCKHSERAFTQRVLF